MSQNQVSIIAPRSEPQQQKRQKPTDIENVLTGLQIANGVLGIGTNLTTIQNHMAQTQALEDERNGIITSKQMLDKGSSYERVDPGTAGSTTYKVRTDKQDASGNDTYEQVALRMPSRVKEQAAPTTRVFDGKQEQWNPSTGKWDVIATATPKPKETKTRAITSTDENGNQVTEIVPDVIGTKRTSAPKAGKDPAFDALPKPAQETVKSLTQVNAQKTSIANQIDAELSSMQKAYQEGNEDQAIAKGKNMLKVLNSTEGKDAVGTDEAKRLASFLEYKIGNFRDPGSFIGRDTEEFFTQAADKSNSIKDAINHNQQIIDSIYKNNGTIPAPAPIGNSIGKKGSVKPAAAGTAIAGTGGNASKPSAELHPAADTAESWANDKIKNGTPDQKKDAADILRRLGKPVPSESPNPGPPSLRDGNRG